MAGGKEYVVESGTKWMGEGTGRDEMRWIMVLCNLSISICCSITLGDDVDDVDSSNEVSWISSSKGFA